MSETKDISIATDTVAEIDCEHCGVRLNVAAYPSLSKIACPQCKTEQVVPGKLGPFLLTGLLGCGGMGATYQGRDEQLNRAVAVKIMLKTMGEDAESVQHFRREAQAIAALNHPNVVQIYSFGIEKGQPYIVMELLMGGRLDDMISSGETLSEALIMKIGVDVAEGLNAAYAIGLVHGDVKPENILLDANGVGKVVDFGLAHFRDREAGREGIWGTPYYIAPEKVRRQPGDARSDIYSLGATLYHALTGRPPFEGKTPLAVVKARLEHLPEPLASLRSGIHPEVETIIHRMLDPEPSKRYPTYMSLIADIRRTLSKLEKDLPSVVTQRRGGKIVLTKTKGRSSRVSGQLASASSRLSGKVPVAMEVNRAPLGIQDTVPPEEHRRRRKRTLIWVGAIAVVAIIATTVIVTVMRRKDERERAEEELRRRTALLALRSSAEESETDAKVVYSNIMVRVNKLGPGLALGSNRVSEIAKLAKSLAEPAVAKVVTNAPAISGAVTNSQDLLKEAEKQVIALRKAARDALSLKNNVENRVTGLAQETNVGRAQQVAEDLRNLREELSRASLNAEKFAKVAEPALNQITNLYGWITLAKDTAEKEARRLADQDREAKAKQEAEAAARKKEEERKAQVKKELGWVNDAWTTNLALIRKGQFKEAAEELKKLKELGTDDGQKALKVVTERYEALQQLTAFIEARAGAKVSWSTINPQQMHDLILRFVDDPTVPKPEKAQRQVNAAVYYYEIANALEKEKAGRLELFLPFARDRVKKAVELDPSLNEQVERLLPDLHPADKR